jgi:tRNA A-37 threonylcarbamoyl transferase component Bud32
LKTEKIRWTVSEEYQEALPPHILNRIINLEDIAEHRTVRALPSRTVRYVRPSSPGIPDLYLKEYKLPALFDRIKNMFLSPAEKEYRTAQKLTERNILTFVPLAVGKLVRCGLLHKNYLISKSIDNATSLKEYMNTCYSGQAGRTAEEKKNTIESLAKFVNDLHQKGIFHQDFHWGNILIEKGSQGSIRFYLMDLHRVKLKSKLTDRERIKNLASLNTGLSQKTRRTERLRFLKAYLGTDKSGNAHYSRFARLIEKTTNEMMRTLWHKREKRCLKNNKYFAPFKSDTYKGFINRDFFSPELLGLLHNPDRAFSEPASTIIKDSHTTSSCTLPLQLAGEKVEIHIKRYNYQNIFYALKNLFRSSRGKRVWKAAHGLALRAVTTPQPVSFVEQRKGRFLIKSFFITQKVDQSLPLITLLQNNLSGTRAETSESKNALIHQVAKLVRMMHKRGIRHRDLKSSNILAQKMPGHQEKLYLVDLDSARIKKRSTKEDAIKDLARLNASLLDTKTVSTPDRLRFLKYYLHVRKTKNQKVRDYWQEIVFHTKRKLEKSERKFN